ncbi:unnamed protein product [Clonostachys solani]|uniref:Glutamine synthetase n=1 Tax=Clonostachys solani TaxID=160281 RepID=A0A9P0EPS3_9HYPO|nr:unnamed protein product [Clonostachys solani]
MTSEKHTVEDFLPEHEGRFKYVRQYWVDYSGVLRARFIPIDRCLRIAEGTENYHLAQGSMIIPISTAPKVLSLGDRHETWELVPDWSSLRPCGSNHDHATVMCSLYEKGSSEKCPRKLLEGVLGEFRISFNSTFLLGFEIQFMLLDPSGEVHKPMDRLNGSFRTAGLRTEMLDIMDEILQALRTSNIPIQHFNTGLADQLKISLIPETPLEAIDSLILAQVTIRTICLRHNLRATMAPKPLLNGPFNCVDLHLSTQSFHPEYADNFLAGILAHVRSLCAFGLANFDSYVRAVNGYAGESLVSGQTTVTSQRARNSPDLPETSQRTAHGLTVKMPGSLQEALDHLKEDSVMRDILSRNFLNCYTPLKEKEVEEFAKMTEEERRLRFLKYF